MPAVFKPTVLSVLSQLYGWYWTHGPGLCCWPQAIQVFPNPPFLSNHCGLSTWVQYVMVIARYQMQNMLCVLHRSTDLVYESKVEETEPLRDLQIAFLTHIHHIILSHISI